MADPPWPPLADPGAPPAADTLVCFLPLPNLNFHPLHLRWAGPTGGKIDPTCVCRGLWRELVPCFPVDRRSSFVVPAPAESAHSPLPPAPPPAPHIRESPLFKLPFPSPPEKFF